MKALKYMYSGVSEDMAEKYTPRLCELCDLRRYSDACNTSPCANGYMKFVDAIVSWRESISTKHTALPEPGKQSLQLLYNIQKGQKAQIQALEVKVQSDLNRLENRILALSDKVADNKSHQGNLLDRFCQRIVSLRTQVEYLLNLHKDVHPQ